ncbi:tetratricopeptide repeat protein [Kribbella sp. NPDC050124]|uniref:tetratricopeptide repeat protein n=1 Tax=Kribbella sp. NPDC050124 TaxID=3364114 RepID=UPI0037903DFA
MAETFAGVLRRARVRRGLTQEGLAELAGLSAQAIGLLERGVRRFPHLTTLDRLTGALGLTAGERAEFQRLASRGAVSQQPASTHPSGAAWVVAHQLPAATTFVGRRRPLDQLAELLARPAAGPGAPAIATIRGMPGVGKTALAIAAGHASAGHYPDGVLIVNARGFGSGTPLSALQALGQLLRATGVPADAVPDSLPEAAATFRTRLANRRVLILLDNVRDVGQVAELIPAAGGSAVLITSRNTLTELPAALHLQLEPMTAEESLGLLDSLAGAGRIGAAARVAELCGHLPLALSVAGAWLIRHPHNSADELAERLADESRRLDLLGVDDLDVRASLSLSIDQLISSPRNDDPAAADALALLSLSDAVDFTEQTAAAMLDTDPPRAGRMLDRLADLHLLESRKPGRYHFHDLVRTFGRELAAQHPEDERRAALDRTVRFYLAVAWRAAELADPGSARMAWPGRPSAPPVPALDGSQQALSWIDAELPNFLALIDQLRALGHDDELAGGLVIGLFDYFVKRGNLAEWLPAIDRVTSGRLDRWTLGQLHADAAIALAELARYDDSLSRFRLARDTFESIGNLRGVSLASNNTARLLIRMRRYDEARPLAEQALAANEELADDRAVGSSLLTLAEIHLALGEHARSEECAEAALGHLIRAGDPGGAANARVEVGWARVGAGRPGTAIEPIRTAIGELDALGHQKNVSDARYALALTYRQLDDREAAIEELEQVVEIAADVRDRRREARARLELGELLDELGEHEDAVPNLEFALAFYREHDPVPARRAAKLLGADSA